MSIETSAVMIFRLKSRFKSGLQTFHVIMVIPLCLCQEKPNNGVEGEYAK
jgi:hypothetical protein